MSNPTYHKLSMWPYTTGQMRPQPSEYDVIMQLPSIVEMYGHWGIEPSDTFESIISDGDFTWSTVHEEMCAMSKQFPDTLFKLEGEGEQARDIWVAYYLNGQMQFEKANITIDRFDPAKLEEYQTTNRKE